MPQVVDPQPFLEKEDEFFRRVFNVLEQITIDRQGLEKLVSAMQEDMFPSEYLQEDFNYDCGLETESGEMVKYDPRELFKDGKPTAKFEELFSPDVKVREGVTDKDAYTLGRIVHQCVFMFGVRYIMRKQTIMMDALRHKDESFPEDYLTQVRQIANYYGFILALSLFTGNMRKLYYQADNVWQHLRDKEQIPSNRRLACYTEDRDMPIVNLGYNDLLFSQIIEQYTFLNNNIDVLNNPKDEDHDDAVQMWLGLYRLYDVLKRVKDKEGKARMAEIKLIIGEHCRLMKDAIVRNLQSESLPEKNLYFNFPELRRYGHRF